MGQAEAEQDFTSNLDQRLEKYWSFSEVKAQKYFQFLQRPVRSSG